MKTATIALLTFAFLPSIVLAAPTEKHYQGSGEVTSVDPLYSRITIKHGPIKNFVGDEETEFFVSSTDILKGIAKRDLVDFSLVDVKGDVRVEKITKTGEAPIKEEGLPLGQAVQGALVATGEAAKTVTSPITPAHEVVSGTVGATTGATDEVLRDANPDVKKKF